MSLLNARKPTPLTPVINISTAAFAALSNFSAVVMSTVSFISASTSENGVNPAESSLAGRAEGTSGAWRSPVVGGRLRSAAGVGAGLSFLTEGSLISFDSFLRSKRIWLVLMSCS